MSALAGAMHGKIEMFGRNMLLPPRARRDLPQTQLLTYFRAGPIVGQSSNPEGDLPS